jgi:hypothetical protein
VIVSLIFASTTVLQTLTTHTFTSVSTVTQTETIESKSITTLSSVATLTTTVSITNALANQLNTSNYPTTCAKQYPSGINMKQSTLLVMTSPDTFAQVCMKYVYDNAFNLTSYNANFTGEMMVSQQFGGSGGIILVPDLSQVVAYPHNVIFNKTGDTATVTYTMTTSSMIYEYFRPDYYCSAFLGIPISEENGNWTSPSTSSCGPLTPFQSDEKIVGLTNLVVEGN